MSRMLVGLGYPPPRFHLPYWFVYLLALLLHMFTIILRPFKTIRPTFTPMTVALAGTYHYYSSQRAKQDMNYTPVVPLDLAIQRTIDSYPELRAPAPKQLKGTQRKDTKE